MKLILPIVIMLFLVSRREVTTWADLYYLTQMFVNRQFYQLISYHMMVKISVHPTLFSVKAIFSLYTHWHSTFLFTYSNAAIIALSVPLIISIAITLETHKKNEVAFKRKKKNSFFPSLALDFSSTSTNDIFLIVTWKKLQNQRYIFL